MNLPNKITMARIILSIMLLVMLLLPWYQFGVEFPIYQVANISVNIKYIIAGVIFLIASTSDFLDGYLARKNNMVTDFGKVMDAIADKVLVNGLLILLAYNRDISVIVPVVIITRDIFVDSIKMVSGSKGKVVAASIAGKIKTACMMVGLTLVLFSNLPFELFGIGVGQGLVLLATCMSVYSGIEYFMVNKEFVFGDM